MDSAEATHHATSLSPEEGPFTFARISRRLARLPGRFEVDEGEARRALFHFIQLYEQNYFGDDEVVALYGNPPRFRPLKSLPKKAQQLLPVEWRDGAVSLTAPALRRYLERSPLNGAPRLLAELFGTKRATDPKIEVPAVSAENDIALPAGQARGNGSREITKHQLTAFLRNVKEQGGPAPAADRLLAEVKAAFPGYRVTRDDVRTVHREVFGQLPPGKRSKGS